MSYETTTTTTTNNNVNLLFFSVNIYIDRERESNFDTLLVWSVSVLKSFIVYPKYIYTRKKLKLKYLNLLIIFRIH